MDLNDVNSLAQHLAIESFGMKLDIPILIEELDCFGRCFPILNETGKPKDMSHISIDATLANIYPDKYIKGLLLHELCHWSLFREGLPCNDGDVSFNDEMRRVGGLFQNDMPLVGDYYVFRCKKCYKEAGMFKLDENLNQLKDESKNHRCSRCGSRIKYFGVETVNQLETGLESS